MAKNRIKKKKKQKKSRFRSIKKTKYVRRTYLRNTKEDSHIEVSHGQQCDEGDEAETGNSTQLLVTSRIFQFRINFSNNPIYCHSSTTLSSTFWNIWTGKTCASLQTWVNVCSDWLDKFSYYKGNRLFSRFDSPIKFGWNDGARPSYSPFDTKMLSQSLETDRYIFNHHSGADSEQLVPFFSWLQTFKLIDCVIDGEVLLLINVPEFILIGRNLCWKNFPTWIVWEQWKFIII